MDLGCSGSVSCQIGGVCAATWVSSHEPHNATNAAAATVRLARFESFATILLLVHSLLRGISAVSPARAGSVSQASDRPSASLRRVSQDGAPLSFCGFKMFA